MAEPVNNLLSGYVAPDVKRRMSNALLANQFNRPTPQDGPVTERAGLLPLGTYANGQTGIAWPGFIAQPAESFYKAATGQIQPGTPEFAEAGFDVGGAAMVGGLLAPRPRGSLGMGGRPEQPKGITAYHGSPHDFDRFDMSKIGTGEGAQAYGHGLYFAENEGVAKQYRDRLGTAPWRTLDGAGGDWAKVAKSDIEYYNGNVDAALSQWRDLATRKPDSVGGKAAAEKLAAYERGEVEKLKPGKMYEVRINADPNDFLDWDKPLSQQSEKVREMAAAKVPVWDVAIPDGRTLGGNWTRADADKIASEGLGRAPKLKADFTGERLVKAMAVDPTRTAQVLREAGIPGIRYLDQGSRTAGEGSRNYVVFDDSLVEILRKYGLAGFGAGAAAYGMEPSQQAPPVNNLLASYYGGT